MTNYSAPFKNSTISKIFFISSIVILAFWITGNNIDVYKYDITGGIFEFLWLFMILGLFVLPVVSLILLIKEKFNFRSLYLYTIIITVTTLLLLFFM